MPVADIVLIIIAFYATLGLLFALAFIARGIERVDPAAHGASLGFRLLMLPGCAALWPLMALKWRRAPRRP